MSGLGINLPSWQRFPFHFKRPIPGKTSNVQTACESLEGTAKAKNVSERNCRAFRPSALTRQDQIKGPLDLNKVPIMSD